MKQLIVLSTLLSVSFVDSQNGVNQVTHWVYETSKISAAYESLEPCTFFISNSRGVCVTLAECPTNPEIYVMTHRLRLPLFSMIRVTRPSNCSDPSQVCCLDYPMTSTVGNIMPSLLPSPGECGVPTWISIRFAIDARFAVDPVSIGNRVANGQEAGLEEFPWSALIIDKRKRGRDALFCGGSLINHQYVVTAAHCVDNLPEPGRILVRLGEHKINVTRDCMYGFMCNDPPIDVEIEERIIHPNYNSTSMQNDDIALLRLVRPVNFTDFIKPICLPISRSLRNMSTDNFLFEFSGWGQTGTNEPKSDEKRKVELRGVSQVYCSSKYSETDPPRQIVPSMLCALGDNGKDTCRGDSGSGLVAIIAPQNQVAHFYLAGISSFGVNKCAKEGWPSVFTRVTSYIEWIAFHLRS